MRNFTYENFYHSKEWEKLRAVIIAERTNEQGVLLCERCGKPILKRYDCIAHHEQPLNADNVNDASVSLNPENIKLVHARCHNIIHDKHGFSRRQVFLVYGSPCSGKTTFVNETANGDDLILDIDRLWDALCNEGRYSKTRGKSSRPHRLKANVFGVRDCIIEQIKTRSGRWRNAYIIGGFPLRSDRDRLCELLDAEPVYIESTLQECLARAEKERPDEWKNYIQEWFNSFIP